MADFLSEIKDQIIGKNKSEVMTLLGTPVKTSYWKNTRPDENADAAAIATFEAQELDEIWIYSNGRVHFSMSEKALNVDDQVSFDMPPDDDTFLRA